MSKSFSRRSAPAIVVTAGVLLSGCTLPRAEPSLLDSDPTAKIPAIKSSAESSDQKSVATLVEELDSDDPAVRFYAIRALQDITGHTFGYRYFDDELERREELYAWRVWLAKEIGGPMPEPLNAGPATTRSVEL